VAVNINRPIAAFLYRMSCGLVGGCQHFGMAGQPPSPGFCKRSVYQALLLTPGDHDLCTEVFVACSLTVVRMIYVNALKCSSAN